jgi:rhamnulokinase
MSTYLAVDLGASSGRVFAARLVNDKLDLTEIHRFANEPMQTETGMHWNITSLFEEIRRGLSMAAALYTDIVSIGIDSWAVDYGLLNASGALIEQPFHYRDVRTEGAAEKTYARMSAENQYAHNGLQYLPFNTLFQLEAAQGSKELAQASTLLMIPDLLGFWLTGVARAEETNASTTGVRNIATGEWSGELASAIGLDLRLMPQLASPGTVLGRVSSDIVAETGLADSVVVTLVGSHDTASAVAGVPAINNTFAYVSCGTWGLVGVELDRPILTEASRAANFTNECGIDGTTRFLRNVTGLWLVQETLREWRSDSAPGDSKLDLETLVRAAEILPDGGPTFDANHPSLMAPGDMANRISQLLGDAGVLLPLGRDALLRSIFDSLAWAFADAVSTAGNLSGKTIEVVHIVGGGSQNDLLCQLIADRCSLPVLAGPVEATVAGNALVQMRASGELRGGLSELRKTLTRSFDLKTFLPRVSQLS